MYTYTQIKRYVCIHKGEEKCIKHKAPCLLKKVEEMLELQNYHFATIIVNSGSNKNHQETLNLGKYFNEE